MTDTSAPPGAGRPGGEDGRPSPLERQAQLRASSGFRAIALRKLVERMSYLLQGNVTQYRSLVARLQDPAVSLPILGPHALPAHDDLLTEAERLLHNVLTAMSTRVDQQRRFMDQNFGDDPVLTREYRDRVASCFGGNEEAGFLKGLRNYIAHRQLPVAQTRQTFTNGSYEVTFVLPGKPLLSWDGWSPGARSWIAGQGETVTIVDAVDAYARLAGDFDQWLAGRIELKYQAEIAAFLAVQEEYARQYAQVFGG
jgi:hypothetical protein